MEDFLEDIMQELEKISRKSDTKKDMDQGIADLIDRIQEYVIENFCS